LRASKSRLSKAAPTGGSRLASATLTPAARKLAIITMRTSLRRRLIPRRSGWQRNLNGGDSRLTVMHPCCTYNGTDSKWQKNGSADRDHQILLKAQLQRDAIVHDLASVDLPSAQHIDRSGNRGARRAVYRPACPHLAPAIPVRFSSNARNARLVAIGTITILLIVGYISLLRYFHVSEMPVERDLGLKSAVGPTPQIYIEPISIDALNDAMQMRVSFAPRTLSMGSGWHRQSAASDW
jgi:hypothetical protein